MIREDPKNENVLYIGTDLGVYVSLNKGDSWISLCSNLPTAFVHDLVVHPRDDILVIGTHGRSVYVMNVGPVQEYDQKISGKDFHMFGIPAVYLTQQRGVLLNLSGFSKQSPNNTDSSPQGYPKRWNHCPG